MRVANLLTSTRLLETTLQYNLPSTLVGALSPRCTPHQLEMLSKWPTFDFAFCLDALAGGIPDCHVSEDPEAKKILMQGMERSYSTTLNNVSLMDLLINLRKHLPAYAHSLTRQVIAWQSLIGMPSPAILLRDMQDGDRLVFAFDPISDHTLNEDNVKVVEVERILRGYHLTIWLPHPRVSANGLYSYHAQTTVNLETTLQIMITPPCDLLPDNSLKWDRWTKKRLNHGPLSLRLVMLLILHSGLKHLSNFFQPAKL